MRPIRDRAVITITESEGDGALGTAGKTRRGVMSDGGVFVTRMPTAKKSFRNVKG